VPAKTLRALARAARHLPDRLLHASRRTRATRRLARGLLPSRVLFICHGNICRSPYAAAAARTRFPRDIAVDSAGFFGPGRASPDEAIQAARERSADLSQHRSQLLSAVHLRHGDLFVVMDVQQRRRLLRGRHKLRGRVVLLGDFDPEPSATRTILDPVERPVEAFRSCYARIDRCVAGLAAAIRAVDEQEP
jgi:protein-tyrosine phosphatase